MSAAVVVRSMLGVSPSAYEEACAGMGPENAATVIACILERGGHINSPGGYLRDLTRRTERGEFAIGPMLMALVRFGWKCLPRIGFRDESGCFLCELVIIVQWSLASSGGWHSPALSESPSRVRKPGIQSLLRAPGQVFRQIITPPIVNDRRRISTTLKKRQRGGGSNLRYRFWLTGC
jgi:hypothetical protein